MHNAHAKQKLSEHNVCTSNTIFSNFRCVFSLRNTRSTIPILEIKCIRMVVRTAYSQLIKQPKAHIKMSCRLSSTRMIKTLRKRRRQKKYRTVSSLFYRCDFYFNFFFLVLVLMLETCTMLSETENICYFGLWFIWWPAQSGANDKMSRKII